MQKIFETIFDLIFPRRANDAAIADISPEDFYENMPRWNEKIRPNDMGVIFHYRNPTVKAMVKEFKSSKNEHAVEIAAYALANFFEENGIRGAIIIPMPISKKRRKKRGYNQCEFLAEFFVKEISSREKAAQESEKNGTRGSLGSIENPTAPLGQKTNFEIRTDILEKPIDTPKLALQNRAARLTANEGVFRACCNLSSVKERIIVIDDVITTGSTMYSAMETLRKAGARDVSGIGIAH